MRYRITMGVVALSVTIGMPLWSQERALPDIPAIDARLAALRTGGHWESATQSGYYRVLQIHEGWEEVRRRVVVQWLAVATERAAPTVVATVDLVAARPELWSLSDPELTFDGRSVLLTVHTTVEPLAQPTGQLTYELGAPGEVGLVRAP